MTLKCVDHGGKQCKFRLETREIVLAIVIAVLGFIFSMKGWILFLDKQNAFVGLLIYYVIMYSVLFALKSFGLVLFGVNIKSWSQTFGLILIIFAFFVVFNWESPYVNLVTHGNIDNVSNIYFQAEDGAMWTLWSMTGIANLGVLRILTFMISPSIIALLGGFLLVSKPRLGG